MTRTPDDITKTLRRVLKRARAAQTAADVRVTPAERLALLENLLPAAIAHARANERRRAHYAVLCGCRVFVRTTVYGAVIVSPDKDAAPVAMSNAMRV